MRKLAFLGLVAMCLAGCDALESNDESAVKVCEAFIQDRLKAPATYSRVELTVEMKQAGQPTRDVFISYDAANAYGTPIRSIERCTFDTLPNGDFPTPSVMGMGVSNAERAEIMAQVNSLHRAPGSTPVEPVNCCLLDPDQRETFLK